MISVQDPACTDNQGFAYIPDLPLKRNAPPERGEFFTLYEQTASRVCLKENHR